METVISILRGINVSGKNKIPMVELKTLYEKAGFKNVITYIQSGNVVFKTKDSVEALPEKIHQLIFKKYKYTVPIIIRTLDDMESVVNANPFSKIKGIDLEKLHVTFLSESPAEEHLDKIKQYQFKPDEYVILQKEVYLYCPDTYGNTKLSNTFFENKLKATATTRNWRTVNELVRIAKQL